MKNVKKLMAVIAVAGILTGSTAGSVWAEDYEPLGLYTETGYENTFFGFKCEVPREFVLNNRSLVSAAAADQAEVISNSNAETTLSLLDSSLSLGSAEVFNAFYDTSFITLTLQKPGFGNDRWDEPEAVVDGSIEATRENLQSAEGVTVTDVQVEKVQREFMDEEMWGMDYSCTMNEAPIYGKTVILISEDKGYALSVEAVSTDAAQTDAMLGYFSKLS